MIAAGIRFLCGYAAATDLARQRPEWPIHPGRIFLAMAAAHYETGGDSRERAALEWLEAAGPPEIFAGRANARSYVKAYVPVNDELGNITGRLRQERAFPKCQLEDEVVYLLWDSHPPPAVRLALEQVCAKVTRVGHSSSLVQMWIVDPGAEPKPNWILSSAGERMRVQSVGTMATLDNAFNAAGLHQLEEICSKLRAARGQTKINLKRQLESAFPTGKAPFRRPELTRWQAYEQRTEVEQVLPVEGPFDSNLLILTKFEGRNLGLEATLALTKALRSAAMKAASTNQARPPEWLSGHAADETPSVSPHAAFFPLPFVGAEHADGHLMGLAIALPRDIDRGAGEPREESIRKTLGALFFDVASGEERTIRLWSGKESWSNDYFWQWKVRREARERPPLALQVETWTRPSRVWASVTPVVLHHYPNKTRADDVERILREAFASALLPVPEEVIFRSVSAVPGAGHALSMPPYDEGGTGLCRYHAHVRVIFPVPVRGPVLVGRGRYRGYGLFKPLTEAGENGD